MLLKCPSCGGKIRAPEAGSQERFSFLCQECQQIVHLHPGSDEIPTTSSPPRVREHSTAPLVLVVDDTRTFAEMVTDMLFKEGYDVSVASDGVEALKKITDERPDVIFLDLFMPRMTGFEVLRVLRTSPAYSNLKSIPVLVTSGIYHPAEFEILSQLGASGYIGKEQVEQELVFRMRKLIGKTPEAQK